MEEGAEPRAASHRQWPRVLIPALPNAQPDTPDGDNGGDGRRGRCSRHCGGPGQCVHGPAAAAAFHGVRNASAPGNPQRPRAADGPRLWANVRRVGPPGALGRAPSRPEAAGRSPLTSPRHAARRAGPAGADHARAAPGGHARPGPGGGRHALGTRRRWPERTPGLPGTRPGPRGGPPSATRHPEQRRTERSRPRPRHTC